MPLSRALQIEQSLKGVILYTLRLSPMAHEDRIHFPAFSRNFELLDVSRGRNIRRVPWQLLLASLIRLVDPARGHQY